MLKHFIIQFMLYYLSRGHLWRIKTNENFKLFTLKVVAVAYKRWSLTRGSKYRDLTWKILVFWKTGVSCPRTQHRDPNHLLKPRLLDVQSSTLTIRPLCPSPTKRYSRHCSLQEFLYILPPKD